MNAVEISYILTGSTAERSSQSNKSKEDKKLPLNQIYHTSNNTKCNYKPYQVTSFMINQLSVSQKQKLHILSPNKRKSYQNLLNWMKI